MGNVNGINTEPEIVIEAFNEAEVMRMIDEFDGLGKKVFNSIDSMDSLVADNVQVASGAVAGTVGGKLFKEWSENCVPLLNYSRFFDGISESMRRIYNRSSDTAEAIESIYKTEDPNALSNTTSTPISGDVPIGETVSQEETTPSTESKSGETISQEEKTPSDETTDIPESASTEENDTTITSDTEKTLVNEGDEQR